MENLIISTVVFGGDPGDANTYQLGFRARRGGVVYILRNFKGDQARQDVVPSGWFYRNAYGLKRLCIDGRTDWYVRPTTEAWENLDKLILASV